MVVDYDAYRKKLQDIINNCEEDYVLDDDLAKFTDELRDRWSLEDLKLYRYSPADYYNIRNFETGKLRLSNVGVLNDVYEGIPIDIRNSLDQVMVNQLKDVAQIKCFSETPFDEKMWGYYAKDHTGFCVEYDISELDSNDTIINHLFPVLYSTKRSMTTDVQKMIDELKQLRIDIRDRNVHDYEDYLNDITALFLFKGEAWSYEREWRIVYTLLQIYEEDREELYAGIIQFDCITGIYLGNRIEKEIEENIKEIVKRINKVRDDNGRTTIAIYKAYLNDDSYKLAFRKFNEKTGEYICQNL